MTESAIAPIDVPARVDNLGYVALSADDRARLVSHYPDILSLETVAEADGATCLAVVPGRTCLVIEGGGRGTADRLGFELRGSVADAYARLTEQETRVRRITGPATRHFGRIGGRGAGWNDPAPLRRAGRERTGAPDWPTADPSRTRGVLRPRSCRGARLLREHVRLPAERHARPDHLPALDPLAPRTGSRPDDYVIDEETGQYQPREAHEDCPRVPKVWDISSGGASNSWGAPSDYARALLGFPLPPQESPASESNGGFPVVADTFRNSAGKGG